MDRKKKVKLFLVAMVVLYVLATSFGLTRDDGAMGKAMREVREVVADARAEIKKEMDKPFILRLFGSLFGMENNTFDRMKKRLPEILKNAMPDLAESFTFTPPDTGVSCEGMRLADALIYLREECVPLEELLWTWDDWHDGAYIKLSGTVLKAEETETGAARLVLQYFHPYNGEEGLGEDGDARSENRAALAAAAQLQRTTPPPLSAWLPYEDAGKLQAAVLKGFDLDAWRDRPLAFVELPD